MKSFIRNYVKRIIDRLFGSMITELVLESHRVHTLIFTEINKCDYVTQDDYDFDEFMTKRDFDLQRDDFDPDDFVRCDNFNPDDYVRCQDCDPNDFVYTSDFNPDNYVTHDEFHGSLNGYKKSIHLDFANFEKKLVTPTQHEVITFLTKLTLCATDYCTAALEEGIEQQ